MNWPEIHDVGRSRQSAGQYQMAHQKAFDGQSAGRVDVQVPDLAVHFDQREFGHLRIIGALQVSGPLWRPRT
jgi:hypothetical protein